MIRKTRAPALPAAYLRYVFQQADPQEDWQFEAAGLHGRVVNGWRSGLSLFVGEQLVGHTDRMIALGGADPFLVAEVTDEGGQKRRVEVFLRAIFTVKLRLVVDGQPLNRRYM